MDYFVCKYPKGARCLLLGEGCALLVVTCHPRRDSAATITIISFPLFTVQSASVMMKSVSFAHCEGRSYSFPGFTPTITGVLSTQRIQVLCILERGGEARAWKETVLNSVECCLYINTLPRHFSLPLRSLAWTRVHLACLSCPDSSATGSTWRGVFHHLLNQRNIFRAQTWPFPRNSVSPWEAFWIYQRMRGIVFHKALRLIPSPTHLSHHGWILTGSTAHVSGYVQAYILSVYPWKYIECLKVC